MDKILQYGRIKLRFTYKFRKSLMFARNFNTANTLNENVTSTEGQSSDDVTKVKLSGFAQAFEKFSIANEAKDASMESKPRTFVSLLRHSKFIDLGDPEGKVVTGEIFHVVGDDLYIDFGWKFHCVCPKPKKYSSKYVRGSKVSLKIKDLELSTRFLGASSDLTILEADCILLNLISSPSKAE